MSIELPVAFIEEDDAVVAYTPALDLSTCGKDHEDAKRMFAEAVQIFFKDLADNDTLEEVLGGLGWKRSAQHAAWYPPKISHESLGIRVPVAA